MRDEPLLLRELESLYREVDAAHEGTTCPRSSECCRFGITGREPQVTSLELALVRRAVRARGGPLKAERRALPLQSSHEREGTCPMLDRSGGCTIYAARPLGCRTFFCDGGEGPRVARADVQRLARAIADLSDRFAPNDPGPRPLSNVSLGARARR